MTDTQTEVLIVGGGPVGLAAASFLSDLGISSILVERNKTTARHPKARGVNARAMELLRQIGCEHYLRQAAEPLELVGAFAQGEHLESENLKRIPFGAADLSEAAQTSSPGVVTSQDVCEEIFCVNARNKSLTDIRFENEFLSLEQNDEGVSAKIKRLNDKAEYNIHSKFLIAADGVRSPVRKLIGSPLEGSEPLTRNLNVMFEADLKDKLAELKIAFFVIRNETRMAILSGRPTGRNDNQWTFNVQLKDDEQEGDFTEEGLIEMIREATNREDLEVTINSISPWTATARVARLLSVGKVFLAGDAAHMMPPAGALGMNTGLQDAHNLTWKLAMVLKGVASPSLLESYHAERYPICDQTVNAARKNLAKLATKGGQRNMWGGSQLGIILGYRYESSAVVSDGLPAPVAENPYSDYIPSGSPGGRAPHMALRGKSGLSTLDLFGGKFVVLAGAQGSSWKQAALDTTAEIGTKIECYVAGDDLELAADVNDFHSLYGTGKDGAVLVRPDGFIAWRSETGHAADPNKLKGVMQQILGLTP